MYNFTENDLKEDFFDLAEEISKKFKITKAEALTAAASFKRNVIEQQRNSLFQLAFSVSDSSPSALEAIAMQLGYKQGISSTIIDAINSLDK